MNAIDVEGDDFTVEGLQATLDAIRERWGGKEHKPQTVSPAMSLGNGACIVAVEDGRVMIIRDDAARALAQARAATEREPDGRVKTFYAEATIARVLGPNRAEEVKRQNVDGEGLMGLFFQTAMFVQEVLGDVPDCMGLEKCQQREASIRAQISRAKAQERENTIVHFPGNKTAQFFEVAARPNEYYQVSLAIRFAPPKQAELPELPRRT
ncbi:hypothetical protein GC167_05970 [bacterium]|nr:hypothetical protein [bacterium]